MAFTRRTFTLSALATGITAAAHAKSTSVAKAPMPFGPTPSLRQLHWQQMETTAFLHFSVNTFTGREWGLGDEDPNIFNPTAFNADSIILTLKQGGIKGVILTCKHHDGFCLWPTKSTDHNISKSKFQNGKGDIVRDISAAAKKHGLKFGVYVSPWDRNNANYGKPEYITTYRQQITELLTQYGPIFEIWFDGANGGDGFYGGAREKRTIDKHTYYDWPNTWALVRKLQPGTVIFSDAGPDVRWVGNEKGIAAENCWSTVTLLSEDHQHTAVPGDVDTNLSGAGAADGKQWIPAECDVSIRKGWFYHPDEQPKSAATLLDIYEKSVGRGAGLLLNVPPDTRGLIADKDADVLYELAARIQKMFAKNLLRGARLQAGNTRGVRYSPAKMVDGLSTTYFATEDDITDAVITAHFPKATKVNLLRMREAIALGQRVRSYLLEARIATGDWAKVASGESIGNCRIVRLEHAVECTELRLSLHGAAGIALQEWTASFDQTSQVHTGATHAKVVGPPLTQYGA